MCEPLTDNDELLFRQIHPQHAGTDMPSSQAFQVFSKDRGELSVDRSSLTTAANSFATFRKNGFQTVAVYGLNVGEFGSLEILCYPKPLCINKAHAIADFSHQTRSGCKSLAKKLRAIAHSRGRLYP